MQTTTLMQATPTVGQRLTSMFIDQFIICLLLVMVTSTIMSPKINTETYSSKTIAMDGLIVLLMIVIYALKDSFNGRSIAKRIMKLQVVDNKTGKVASVLQCFVRNLVALLWIIELFVVLFNPQRRLGDRLANTRVVAIG